jgi:hypothetical protein
MANVGEASGPVVAVEGNGMDNTSAPHEHEAGGVCKLEVLVTIVSEERQGCPFIVRQQRINLY